MRPAGCPPYGGHGTVENAGEGSPGEALGWGPRRGMDRWGARHLRHDRRRSPRDAAGSLPRPRGAKEPRQPHGLPAGDGNGAGDTGATGLRMGSRHTLEARQRAAQSFRAKAPARYGARRQRIDSKRRAERRRRQVRVHAEVDAMDAASDAAHVDHVALGRAMRGLRLPCMLVRARNEAAFLV